MKELSKEEKELLLKDLCARIPYGVKVCAGEDLAMTLKQIDYKCFCESWENEDFKCHSRWMFPYLRPMSSMTEEEKEEYINIKQGECNGCVLTGKGDPNTEFLLVDFFNAHHFDYRGLIEKGLALEAHEGMYN
jgi:hypothetical protein